MCQLLKLHNIGKIMMKEVILVCNDLFGIEVLELVYQINLRSLDKYGEPEYKVIGYLSEKDYPFNKIVSSVKRLGNINNWVPSANDLYILGISDPKEKFKTVDKLKEKGARFQTIVTPWTLAYGLDIGEGSIISAYTIKEGIKIGKFVTIIGAMLSGHKIDDYSTILRFSNIAGNDVGKGSYVGNHVFVPVGKNVGDYCTVADGSIVVNNVKSDLSVSGVPAKKIKNHSFKYS